MATYAIGDLQGCYDPLRRLLDTVSFDPAEDTLWCVGDLVNRGPNSLEVLRLLRSLGSSAVCVLGNHDLALLAVAAGLKQPRLKDTFHAVLEAPDRDELLRWLRYRPLLHHDAALGFTMVHAGLAVQWDLELALSCAGELETTLRGPECGMFLVQMFGDEPRCWDDGLTGAERLRFITNCLTRMRFCEPDGTLCLHHKGSPGSQPPHLMPWFHVPGRKNRDLKIVFGHWGALGYYQEPGIFALESGCGWGKQLIAMCLEAPQRLFSVDCHEIRELQAS